MSEIHVNPADLQEMAEKLRNLSGQATQLATDIEKAIEVGVRVWKGNAATAFKEQFAQISPTLKNTIPELVENMGREAGIRADNFVEADRSSY